MLGGPGVPGAFEGDREGVTEGEGGAGIGGQPSTPLGVGAVGSITAGDGAGVVAATAAVAAAVAAD